MTETTLTISLVRDEEAGLDPPTIRDRMAAMLKMMGRGTKDGKQVHLVILGLSHVNLARLKGGQPIKFDGTEVGLPDTEVMIFAGETEQSMARELQELVGPQTKVHIDPRLRD